MNTLLRKIGPRIERDLRQIAAAQALNANAVLLKHSVPSGAISGAHPQDETALNAVTWTEKTVELRAFVHYIDPTSGHLRHHAEISVGDVILDFLCAGDGGPVPDWSAWKNVRFEFGGKTWSAKPLGKTAPQSFDLRCADQGVVKTIVVSAA